MNIKAVVFDAYGTLYDVQSVSHVVDDAFPGHGEMVAQVWRLKQLEYTWLRSLMGRYEDFSVITRDALLYSLRVFGLAPDTAMLDRILAQYERLETYPDTHRTLARLSDRTLAILSNGSTNMLQALVRNSRLNELLDAVISVDAKKIFKPSPHAYSLIETNLSVKPENVLFVSSNPFDVCGARAFGLKVAWVERLSAAQLNELVRGGDIIRPQAMFNAVRMPMDELGLEPDYRVRTLSDLLDILS